jgi:hypothetical protein
MDGSDRAIIRFELLGVTKAATMVYEDGGWERGRFTDCYATGWPPRSAM